MTGTALDAPRPSVCLFVGPSIPIAEVRAALARVDAKVTILPPAEQGDILRLLGDLPEVIGIVDGQFFHAPAVLHREILLAREQGARVLGAASSGALRAAELDVFGVEGIGEIYRWYRSGKIDGDDEVAVLHASADEGYRPLTEALVSVRFNLGNAQQRGAISARAARNAISALKRLHFTRRTWEAALAAVPEDERPRLADFLALEAVDLKRTDARLLLRTIADRIAGVSSWPVRPPVRVNETSHFRAYRRQYVGRDVQGQHIPDALVLAFGRLLSPSFPDLYRRVSRRCLAVDEARHRGLAPDDSATLLARFRSIEALGSGALFETWLRERMMSADELAQALGERDLEAKILAQYRASTSGRPGLPTLHRLVARDVAFRTGIPGRLLTRPLLMYPGVPWMDPLIRDMKMAGTFASAVEVAGRILRHNATIFERHPKLARAPVRPGLLMEHFAERWRISDDRLRPAIRARGFTGYDDFVEAARHVFVYDRTSAGPYRPTLLTDCFHVALDEHGI